jgi:leucyl/phenylalanyl-tRNA--protein transferase
MPVYLLTEKLIFPPPQMATRDGLLAVGGDLSPDRLLQAYRMGIFPWYAEHEPIMWWSPDPRLVLYPKRLHVTKSLRKTINHRTFRITFDQAFARVIAACAAARGAGREGTWIVTEMRNAYQRLHDLGYAHSAEAWQGDQLVGGLYGVSLGGSFFGESMFTRVSNASKVALVALVRQLERMAFDMVDCQIRTEHMMRFGAQLIPRARFLKELTQSLSVPTLRGRWEFQPR